MDEGEKQPKIQVREPTSRYRRAAADAGGKRSAMKVAILVAFPTTIAVWLGVYNFWPPIAGMADPTARIAYAINCACIAILLCFLTAIEAVSHERLLSDAFDPLAGNESMRMKINLRYLQNTLEQVVLFVSGLLALAIYCSDGRSMRAIVATTSVWILSRAAFWIGYHQGPQYRVVGVTGMAQSVLILLYVCGRFGYEVAGPVGAAVPLSLFGLVEAYLVIVTRSRSE